MIVIMKHGAGKQDIETVAQAIMSQGLKADISSGEDHTVIGAVGDVSVLDMDKLSMMTGVDRVMKVSEPFKRANRKFHPQDTVVKVRGVEIGGKKLCVMAGPCSVESEEQLFGIARAVKASGGLVLRGGAYKPRTSPYAFQGMEKDGLELLAQSL